MRAPTSPPMLDPRRASRPGLVAGAAVVFLFLVGFTSVAAGLLAGALPVDDGPAGRPVALLVLLAALAAWSGGRAAMAALDAGRSTDEGASPVGAGRYGAAAAAGLVAGVAMGLVIALLALLLASLGPRAAGLRTYLAQLSPDAVRLMLLGTSGPAAAGLVLGALAVAGLLGGAAAPLVRAAWARLRGGAGRWRDAGRAALARHPAARPWIQLALAAAVFATPLFLDKYWNFTLGTVGIYVLMALGLNIVVGLAGLLDLGYVAFFAVGAYSMALLTAPQPHGVLWSFWQALPAGVLLAATAGVLLGIPVLRLRGDYLAIVTLGFGEIIRILILSTALTPFTGGPQGVRDIGGPVLGGRSFSGEREFLYLILIGIVLVVLVTRSLERSKVGRAWIALREDETVARAVGIRVHRAKLLAFAIGAAFAGLGGALFAARNQYTGPEDHNLLVSINVLCMVIVGGMGSIPGVVLGAFALKGLPEALRQVDQYRMLAFGALLVTMMIWRPEGLWPSARRRLELPGGSDDPDDEAELPPGEIAVGGDRLPASGGPGAAHESTDGAP